MKDKVSIARIQLLHPKVRDEAKRCIEEAELELPVNMAIRVVQGLRTIEEQNALYAQGRTKPGRIVTNAKGGASYHNYGLALDFALLIDKDGNGTYDELSWDIKKDFDKDRISDWLEVVTAFVAEDWEWGGSFKSIKDYPHLQKSFGYNWKDLLRKYNNKDFIDGTHYLKFPSIL